MTQEDIEKTIEFLLNQQAKFDSRQQEFNENFNENMARLEKNIEDLFQAQHETTVKINNITDKLDILTQAQIQNTADISRLVDIVENTRDYAQQIARLAVATERRITKLEEEK
jgi:hypothetical protein